MDKRVFIGAIFGAALSLGIQASVSPAAAGAGSQAQRLAALEGEVAALRSAFVVEKGGTGVEIRTTDVLKIRAGSLDVRTASGATLTSLGELALNGEAMRFNGGAAPAISTSAEVTGFCPEQGGAIAHGKVQPKADKPTVFLP